MTADRPSPVPLPQGNLSGGARAELWRLLGGLDALDQLLRLPTAAGQDGDVPLGRYRARRRVGAGRFGVVLLADDPHIGRRVAIKVPQPAVLSDAGLRERFVREARAVARLDHPDVVPVFDSEEDHGLPYLVAGFVDGPTLSVWMATHPGPVGPRTAAQLVARLAGALQHAHDRGVLHCDLKPSNILLDEAADDGLPGVGAPRVTDFGLARVLEDDPALTGTLLLAGTPLYMAPEQARGERRILTARADVYSLGVLLYELLTGWAPFVGGSDAEVLARMLADAPQPPRQASPAVPRDLEAVCLKCLEKDPEKRYATAAALAEDLGRFLAGEPTTARPIGPAARVWRSVRRHPALAGLALVTGLTLLALPAVATWYSLRLDIEAAARREVEQDVERHRELAETQEFFAGLERVRVRRLEQLPGWTAENMGDIRRLAGLAESVRHRPELRTEAAAALSAIDLGRPLAVAPGFRAYAPAFRPDGGLLALAGWAADAAGSCPVKLLDPATGAEVGTLTCPADRDWEKRDGKGVPDGYRSVAFAPDGRRLVAGTRSGWVVLWDLANLDAPPARWRHTAPLSDPRDERVDRVAFSPTGRLVVSADRWGLAGWDTARGRAEVFRLDEGVDSELVTPAGTPDPLLIVAKGALHAVTEGPPGLRPRVAVAGRVGVVAAGPGPGYLAAVDGGQLRLIDPDTGTVAGQFARPEGGKAEEGMITDVAFRPDGVALAAAAEHDRNLKLWGVAGGRLLSSYTSDGGSLRLAFSPDGSVLVACEQAHTSLFALRSPAVVEVVALQPHPILDADVSAAGDLALSIDHPGGVGTVSWRGPTGAALGRFVFRDIGGRVGGGPRLVSISADGRSVAYRSAKEIWLEQVVRKAAAPAPTRPDQNSRDLKFAPDGRVWVAGSDGLHGWSTTGPDVRVPAPEGVVLTCVAPTRDAVWAGRSDGILGRYLPSGGPPAAEYQLFATPTTAVAASPDGSVVVVGSAGGGVKVIHAADGRMEVDLPDAHRGEVTAAGIGPGGWFVTGSRDRTVKLWDRAGRHVLTLPQTGPVRRVFVSADVRTLTVLAEGERGVRRWHLDKLRSELAALGLDPDLP